MVRLRVEELHVLNLWRFSLRTLSFDPSHRSLYIMHAALDTSSEQDAVASIKTRFTQAWWNERLIIEVELIGQLHMVAGIPLHERAE